MSFGVPQMADTDGNTMNCFGAVPVCLDVPFCIKTIEAYGPAASPHVDDTGLVALRCPELNGEETSDLQFRNSGSPHHPMSRDSSDASLGSTSATARPPSLRAALSLSRRNSDKDIPSFPRSGAQLLRAVLARRRTRSHPCWQRTRSKRQAHRMHSARAWAK